MAIKVGGHGKDGCTCAMQAGGCPVHNCSECGELIGTEPYARGSRGRMHFRCFKKGVAQGREISNAELPEHLRHLQTFDLDAFQSTNAVRGRRWHQGDLTQWSLLEWCGAMGGEAGEASNVAKKLRRLDLSLPNKEAGISKDDVELLKEKLADEVGDTMIYGLLILSVLGVKASDVIERVFDRKSVEYGFPERARE